MSMRGNEDGKHLPVFRVVPRRIRADGDRELNLHAVSRTFSICDGSHRGRGPSCDIDLSPSCSTVRAVGGDVSRSRSSRRTALFSLEDAWSISNRRKARVFGRAGSKVSAAVTCACQCLLRLLTSRFRTKPKGKKGPFEFKEQGSGA